MTPLGLKATPGPEPDLFTSGAGAVGIHGEAEAVAEVWGQLHEKRLKCRSGCGEMERAAGAFMAGRGRDERKSPPRAGAACTRPTPTHSQPHPGCAHRAVHTGRRHQFPEAAGPTWEEPGAERGHRALKCPGRAPCPLPSCVPSSGPRALFDPGRFENARAGREEGGEGAGFRNPLWMKNRLEVRTDYKNLCVPVKV